MHGTDGVVIKMCSLARALAAVLAAMGLAAGELVPEGAILAAKRLGTSSGGGEATVEAFSPALFDWCAREDQPLEDRLAVLGRCCTSRKTSLAMIQEEIFSSAARRT